VLKLFSFPFRAMGTACVVHLYSNRLAAAERAAVATVLEVQRIECRFSRYRDHSNLSAINRVAQQGQSIEVDAETAALIDHAFAAWEQSEGLFDISSGLLRRAWNFQSGQLADQQDLDVLLPRVGLEKVAWDRPRLTFTVPGMELDLGGLAKEYAADRVAELCQSLDVGHGLVDLGGDIRVFGPHPDGQPWSIAIRDPFRPEAQAACVKISRGAIATSGAYEHSLIVDGRRYSHLLDPRTGWPVHGLSSVTTLGEQCLDTGTVSTIAMLKGREGAEWLSRLGPAHLWIDDQGMQGGPLAAPTDVTLSRAA
jgi:thiamine biosynthesis lipoprotein